MHTFQSAADDLTRTGAVYGDKLSRCAGYRIVLPGRMACPHCGSANPRTKCLSPGPDRAELAAEMLKNS